MADTWILSLSIKYCDFLAYAFNILRLIVFFVWDIWERYRSIHTQLTEIAPLFRFQFARFTDDAIADPFDVLNQTTKSWDLITPKFVVSVIGEGEDISQQFSDAITEGLQKITQTTGKFGTRLPQAFWWSLSFWWSATLQFVWNYFEIIQLGVTGSTWILAQSLLLQALRQSQHNHKQEAWERLVWHMQDSWLFCLLGILEIVLMLDCKKVLKRIKVLAGRLVSL